MKPVKGKRNTPILCSCAFEPNRNAACILVDTDAAMPEHHGIRTQSLKHGLMQNLVKIAAVDRKMRIFVARKPAAGLGEDFLPMAIEIGKFFSLNTETFQVFFKSE